MPYNLEIPGQISEFELQAIEILAETVPPQGVIVETGSLFGRSSYAWAQSTDPSAQVVCIDPFAGNKGVRGIEERLGIKYSLETFLEHTKDCENIRVIQGFSPQVVEHFWNTEVFLYFDDSVHTNPGFRRNLQFWSSHVARGGILCGDDYRPRFTDLRAEVDQFCAEHNLMLVVVDFMWAALDPNSSFYDAEQVAERLQSISQQADASRSAFRGARVEGIRGSRDKDSDGFVVELDLSNPAMPDVIARCEPPEGVVLVDDAERILPFDVKLMSCFVLKSAEAPVGKVRIETLRGDERKEQWVDLESIQFPAR